MYNSKNNKIIMHLSIRKNRQDRVLAPIELDKGKRHYWGNVKGDYGFYQSSDKRELQKLSQYRRQSLNNRHRTMEIQTYDPQKQFDSSYSKKMQAENLYLSERQISPQTARQKKKNLLELNSNSIQIQLPAIKRKLKQISEQTQTQTLKPGDTSDKQYFQQKGRQILNGNYGRVINRIRAKTEASDYCASRVRYSPTYVCSYSNPLPTFKLYETNNGKLHYQYGYGQNSS